MDAISQTTFSSAFSRIKMFQFWKKFHWGLFLNDRRIDSDNGLAPSKGQAITWTNGCQFTDAYMHHSASMNEPWNKQGYVKGRYSGRRNKGPVRDNNLCGEMVPHTSLLTADCIDVCIWQGGTTTNKNTIPPRLYKGNVGSVILVHMTNIWPLILNGVDVNLR